MLSLSTSTSHPTTFASRPCTTCATLLPPNPTALLLKDAALLLALYDDGKEIKRNAASLIRARQSLDLAAFVIWVLIVYFTRPLRAIQPQGSLALESPFHVFCHFAHFFATVYAFVRVLGFLVYPVPVYPDWVAEFSFTLVVCMAIWAHW